jgi:hypothetical protein
LPDIAGPVVEQQGRNEIVGKPEVGAAALCRELREEEGRERRNLVFAFP